MIYKIKYILYFFVLLLVQTLILNQISISVYFNIFLYILFILMLPIDTNKYLVLFLGLLMGLGIDLFGSTLGLHSSATVLIAFLRPFILDLYSPRDGYEINKQLNFKNYGLFWFFKYSFTLILIHHFWIFYWEAFSFSHFFFTFVKVITSSVLSFAFIFLFSLLFASRK